MTQEYCFEVTKTTDAGFGTRTDSVGYFWTFDDALSCWREHGGFFNREEYATYGIRIANARYYHP